MTEELKISTLIKIKQTVKLYKTNKPQELLELMKSDNEFNEQQEEKILECIKNLVPGTLTEFTAYIMKQHSIRYYEGIHKPKNHFLEATPQDFKSFCQAFIDRHKLFIYKKPDGQGYMELFANLQWGLESFPDQRHNFLNELAQYITSHNEHAINNLNFIFSLDPEFLDKVFKIKDTQAPFLECLKGFQNEKFLDIELAIKKIDTYYFSQKLEQELGQEKIIKIIKI